MFDKINSFENSLSFVSIFSGLMALLSAFISFVAINYGINISFEKFSIIFSNITFLQAILFVLTFFIGFIIHGIRYLGFDYYHRIRNSKNYKKNLYTRFLFYMFRNGTVIEECLNEKRNLKENTKLTSYKWIDESNNVVLDVWNHAKEIFVKYPQVDIYKFYYYSECFQCFDTIFMFASILTFVLGTADCIIKDSILTKHFIMIVGLSFTFFIFHIFSKKTGKSFARRFFLEIQLGLNLLKNNFEK